MLLRFDPFRELDRAADAAIVPPPPSRWTPFAEAIRSSSTSTCRASTRPPSTSRSSATCLSLRAERRWARADDEEVLASERRQGAFARQLLLGETLDGDKVEADYHDGVLTLTIPVAETAKPHKVAVSHGADTRPIETTASRAA